MHPISLACFLDNFFWMVAKINGKKNFYFMAVYPIPITTAVSSCTEGEAGETFTRVSLPL